MTISHEPNHSFFIHSQSFVHGWNVVFRSTHTFKFKCTESVFFQTFLNHINNFRQSRQLIHNSDDKINGRFIYQINFIWLEYRRKHQWNSISNYGEFWWILQIVVNLNFNEFRWILPNLRQNWIQINLCKFVICDFLLLKCVCVLI